MSWVIFNLTLHVPVFKTLTMAKRCSRKRTNVRAAKSWIAEELENMEAFNVTWQVFPIDTMINKQKLHQLGEFFPSVAVDMRRDVLAAANYREDVAAAMLGNITCDVANASTTSWMQENKELVFIMENDETLESAEEVEWSGGFAANNDSDAWVVIQDNWEVVDKHGEKVRTFADVLRTMPNSKKTKAMSSLNSQGSTRLDPATKAI
ncbi:hypothetical protein Plhal304r1_c002g0008131 [Plasmopara halstedii]